MLFSISVISSASSSVSASTSPNIRANANRLCASLGSGRRRCKQFPYRQVDGKRTANTRYNLSGQQRMATQIEEIIFDSDSIKLEGPGSAILQASATMESNQKEHNTPNRECVWPMRSNLEFAYG